jgi:hypothetical protein
VGILTGDLEIDWGIGMLNREQALQIWASIPDVIRAITSSGPHLFDTVLPVAPLIHRLALPGRKDGWFDRLQDSMYAESSRVGPAQGGVEELTPFSLIARKDPCS